MGNVVLYRKYRPETFDEVLGQDHIVKVLLGGVKNGNISHSYLFSGSRGTGKTSIARILAKEVGCTQRDLYEIDAASNRGIDDIRELRESVQTNPFESPYKVYIIDEVHMLTKEAFNALLKTLEEPPSHTIFILATTELNKIPETVISRCQTFTFRKPPREILKNMIVDVARKEGYELESASADLIAMLGDGSFRDTLGILEKVISSTDSKKITYNEVSDITGAPSSELVNDFIKAISDKDLDKGLKALSQALEGNIDMKIYLELILNKVRVALLIKLSPDMKERMKERMTDEDLAFLEEITKKKDSNITSAVLKELLGAHSEIGKYNIPQLPLELALISIVGEKEK